MKIGIFTDCYYPQVNGVVTSVMMLEEELIKRGHDVYIFTVKVPNLVDAKDYVYRINSIPFSKWKEFRLGVPFFTNLYHKLKNLGIDVIHTHTEFSMGILGKRLAKSLNIPIIHTYHTMYEDYTHYVYRFHHGKSIVRKIIIQTSKQILKSYDGVIAPTEKTKKALERYGVQNNIYIVPTGINLKQFERFDIGNKTVLSLMEKHKIYEDDFVILTLGRLSEEKSVDFTIQQIPTLLETIPNLKYLIVGDGPYKKNLEKLVTSLHLEEHVIFTGQIPFEQVSYYYSMADVFVSASQSETQGLTIMEAMASDLPVVVYNDDNIIGVVNHNETGMLFENKQEFLDAICDLQAHPDKADYLRNEGAKIIKTLSKETYAQKAESVYIDVLKQKTLIMNQVI